ncbi:MAG: hypothetical protein K5695_00650 [Oscillospiraceae bacterium]|nr:hypothetical protein [Oscillospiraceae bacterium]
MQETPKEILEWTEMERYTGKRILKPDAPEEIQKKAIEFESQFYKLTGRRRIVNINIETV